MSERLSDLFEAYLRDGDESPLRAWVAEHPNRAGELDLALDGSQLAQELAFDQPPSTETLNRSRTRLMAQADQIRRVQKPAASRWSLRLPRLAFSLLLVVFFVLSGSSLVVASAQSLPGDGLYPLKRSIETIQLGMTFNPAAHQRIEVLFQERRADEVAQLLARGRQTLVSFDGVVSEQTELQWIIGGVPVVIDAQTQVIGEIMPGMTVEVEGETQPAGWVLAAEIHLRFYGFTGTLDALTSEYLDISGQRVFLLSDSLLEPDLVVGETVVALVRVTDAGIVYARRIFTDPASLPSNAGLITPTPTQAIPLAPLSTATPAPTQVRLSGRLQEISAWQLLVAGQTVRLTGQTRLPAGLQAGDQIEVLGYRDVDQQIVAVTVSLLDPAGDQAGGVPEIEVPDADDDEAGEIESPEDEPEIEDEHDTDSVQDDDPVETETPDEHDEPDETDGTDEPVKTEEPNDD